MARYGERYRWQVLAVVAVGLMAGILPSGSFVVAIPAVLKTFHGGQSSGQLIMTSFMVTNTIAMLPAPWLINRYGTRTCFMWTMVLLAITSVLGAFSPNFWFLIAMRAVQGACTGTLMPMNSIVVMRLFEPKDQGRAAGIMGLSITLAPAIAPTIAGVLVDYWGWRSVSLMPVPMCVLAWFAAARYLPFPAETERVRFDLLGMVLLALLTLGWLGTVSNFTAHGTARYWLIGSLAILLLSAYAFWRHARAHAKPLIDLDTLRRRRVAMGVVVSFMLGFSIYGSAYLLPVYLQVALGMSATRAGAALAPGTLALAMSFPVAGFLLDTLSPRQVMLTGTLLFAVSWLALGAFGAQFSFLMFVCVLVISRVGHGFTNTPLNQAAMRGLKGGALTQASALLGYVRQLGGVCGIAMLASFIEWRATMLGDGAAAHVRAFGEVFILVALLSICSIAAIWRLKVPSLNVARS
jgi:MFS transporter, DHA2 family, multidrug resistance protein